MIFLRRIKAIDESGYPSPPYIVNNNKAHSVLYDTLSHAKMKPKYTFTDILKQSENMKPIYKDSLKDCSN